MKNEFSWAKYVFVSRFEISEDELYELINDAANKYPWAISGEYDSETKTLSLFDLKDCDTGKNQYTLVSYVAEAVVCDIKTIDLSDKSTLVLIKKI